MVLVPIYGINILLFMKPVNLRVFQICMYTNSILCSSVWLLLSLFLRIPFSVRESADLSHTLLQAHCISDTKSLREDLGYQDNSQLDNCHPGHSPPRTTTTQTTTTCRTNVTNRLMHFTQIRVIKFRLLYTIALRHVEFSLHGCWEPLRYSIIFST